MKKIIFAITISILMFSCGGENKTEAGEDAGSEVQAQKEESKTDVNEMTAEKYCKVELAKAKLLMDNYWNTFKDKDYADVKDAYGKYKKEKDDIYRKYGVKDQQKLAYFARDNKKEIRKFIDEHPEYDIFKVYPEFRDANVKLYHYAEAAFHDK